LKSLAYHALSPSLAERARRAAFDAGSAVTAIADDAPFPVRCCLRDAGADEHVVLLSAQPSTAPSPYAAPGPIYLHRDACEGYHADGSVPGILRSRLLSVRGFDRAHMMTGTEVVPGERFEQAARRLLEVDSTAYLHVHFAGAGCYACRVEPIF
jgi:hypothetical protein